MTLSIRHQIQLGLVLAVLMLATRFHHAAYFFPLPDASWAIFFVAGFYLRSFWFFVLYCLLAAAIDWIAISWAGVSDFCVTAGYSMLFPAFAVLWFGGRGFNLYAEKRPHNLNLLAMLAVFVLGVSFIAELLSSGGFYFLGDRFAEPTLAEFMPRIVRYFPAMLLAMALYVSLAALFHEWVARMWVAKSRVRVGE